MGKENMNSKEKQGRIDELAEGSLEFFGEELEKVFVAFFDAAASGDDEELVYASTSAWQLTNSISKFFREVVLSGLKNGSGDKARAQAIATSMSQHFQRGMRAIGDGKNALSNDGSAESATEAEPHENIQDSGVLMRIGKPDSSLN